MRLRQESSVARIGVAPWLGLALILGLSLEVSAQCPFNESPLAPRQSQHLADGPITSQVDGLFKRSDLGYGIAILFSLAQLEPVENFDEWASYELTGDVRHKNTWLRWGGRNLGDGTFNMALAAAPLVFGIAVGDSNARRLGVHSLESLFAAAFVARLLKTAVGRARPSESMDPDQFKLFSGEAAFHSFPSGHATRVFALAATFARELGDEAGWVPFVAYSLAAWTATTRVMDRAHWVSDVTAGALLGILTSRVVDGLNSRWSRKRGITLDIQPFPDGGVDLGVAFSLR